MDPQQQRFEYGRQIQFEHRQLDGHQHHQRARWPIRSHGNLDRQRNDRLGRPLLQWGLSCLEHRRQILRGGTEPDTHAYCQSNSDGDTRRDSHRNTDANGYIYTKAHANSKEHTAG